MILLWKLSYKIKFNMIIVSIALKIVLLECSLNVQMHSVQNLIILYVLI